jgi:hypothetical protein
MIRDDLLKDMGEHFIFYVYFCSFFLDFPGFRYPDLGFSVVWGQSEQVKTDDGKQ